MNNFENPNNNLTNKDKPEEKAEEDGFSRTIDTNQLERNFKGQIVNPRTGEPVRKGSPEWKELARRNMLPRNQ